MRKRKQTAPLKREIKARNKEAQRRQPPLTVDDLKNLDPRALYIQHPQMRPGSKNQPYVDQYDLRTRLIAYTKQIHLAAHLLLHELGEEFTPPHVWDTIAWTDHVINTYPRR